MKVGIVGAGAVGSASLLALVIAGIAAYCLASSTEAWTTRGK